ncbi:hypothetical protein F7731_14580 [Cytobacillus depressus]|uniref:Uncharacterized protein n=1 Tax=Cytobacillus depressus TaxID=1602942 RepID=A0A6L3V379_9BACI|nr:hypothetical protein [Cytobacillus depressus]KAB2334438.1 hypothetical protein F7731_14580 [Cytobacillus depressus]
MSQIAEQNNKMQYKGRQIEGWGEIKINKILFFFCNVIAIIGICILFITSILNKVFPMLGKTAFQARMAGSFGPDEYIMDFTLINMFAILLILVASVTGFVIYKKGLK